MTERENIATTIDGTSLTRRLTAVASLAFVLIAMGIPAAAFATTTQGPLPEYEVAGDTEGFRLQLLDFAHELDGAVSLALQDPRIGPILAQQLQQRAIYSPFPESLYQALQFAPPEQIEQIRQAVTAVPGFMSAPAALRQALSQLPPTQLTGNSSAAVSCGVPPQNYATIVARTESLNNLTISKNSIELFKVIAQIVSKIVDDLAGECELIPIICIQIPTSWLQAPFIIIDLVLQVVEDSLSIASAEMQFDITDAGLCTNPWVGHGFSDYKRSDTARTLAGKGCDNRDNDNSEGIDELDEDMFLPTVSFDEAVSAQCFRSAASAEAAARMAVKARDDCAEVDPDISFSLDASTCTATSTATVRDQNPANSPAVASATLKVDGVSPQITLPAPAACYADLAAARDAFSPGAQGVLVSDCSSVRSDLKVTQKQCVADLEFSSVDTCGNASATMLSVRVDDKPPVVRIDNLLIPSVNGLSCFGSQAEAVATVTKATTVSDNCTARQDLVLGSTTSGNSCSLTVTQTAADQCIGVTTSSASDAITVRVDRQAPVVTCSVATPLLWPADDRLVDVGVSIGVSDNCDGTAVPYQVIVTSDEPTMYNLRIMGDKDPAPDAMVDLLPGGAVSRIQLRAQRRQDSGDDGRVYRIRVVATDSCGLASQAECFVTVPKNYSPPSDAGMIINSGQIFDATQIN